MNFKRFNTSDNQWHDIPYYQHKTATDTITTLPADIYANDTTATVGLKGNMEQSSTPTTSNPIQPQETGDRTGNVMPAGEQKTIENNGITFSSDGKGKYSISGTATAYASARFNLLPAFTAPISVSNGGQGTLSFFNTQSDSNVNFIFYNGITWVDDWRQIPSNRVSTTYNAIGNKYVDSVVITVNSGATVDMTITPEFTNDGVIPESFEKYGYKIPISSASTTTPVYLGEVETTRRIKKLVLTGEESGWQLYQQSSPAWRYEVYQFWLDNIIDSIKYSGLYSTIAPFGVTSQNRQDYEYGCYAVSSGKGIAFQMVGAKDTFTNVTVWKTYLQQQYAAGTPVTVWYVLATPTTGIVNEPLRKIGDYADEVSGITIPTIAGANTLSVDTTLQPSEVTATYKGWHPASAVHERENGAWT